ncbi:hypothetical protein A3F27_00420 [Candidatus Kaiserbacteria bacterium RIFCSPHIGHO2_12_FULL_53_13]|uniref:Segregation and condensation protein A n=1 Tax=Candidatus Kaiserbacteria bacterium RIFCSPHIGHO2_12_FULL_53_13 TaxID=1798502 RepID=A0A1F6E7I5_9BACT|nr:MAG: hypothetical protein A3F27_00420 [Candidatus Kaiserbacteria bacterium RIFCSPHIGHO2_12_FULL_53_13]OGG74425.1 MAG: hypothetical protein A3A37_02125 [Candidatus Kaiserbacteria bacterium RIFCSPLOWO2_01_FULL_52_36]
MIDKYSVATEAFAGPLETLLNLIEERRLSISDISLAEVTDTYLAYVEKLPNLPLGETAQFILIASTLLLIKSRSLLPTLQLSENERESVEELERRLARYRIIRSTTKILRREWGRAPLLFPKRVPARTPVFVPGETGVGGIVNAAMRLMGTLPKPQELAEAAVAPVLALEEVIIRLKNRLTKAARARFSELASLGDRHEVIVYFLAVLELVRSGSVSATQERLFSEITLETETLAAPRYGA